MITELQTKAALTAKKRKRSLLYTLLLLVFLGLVMTIIYVLTQHNMVEERENKQYTELAEMEAKITAELNAAGVDLSYYAHSELAVATLATQDSTAKAYLTSLMHNISALHKRYDQIRLFDLQGNEIIRIDQQFDDSLLQTPEDKLQNKQQRYYFQNALTLKPGEVYVSKFDLNKELGEVELPINPMIRFTTPVYDKSGEVIGVGAINYNGKKILQILTDLNVHKGDKVYLLNNEGYYLKGDDPEKEWGFIFPERQDLSFANEHPELWEKMQAHQGRKITTEQGEYYYSYFHLAPAAPFNAVNSEDVFLVMHVPNHIIRAELETLFTGLAIGFLFIAPMLCFLAYKLAYAQVEQDWLFKKLNFEARHDALTGLHNRKAIVTYLEKHISLSRRRNSPLSVAFIDINDLKKNNDLYGHEAGDELIKGAANAITNSIRNSDFAARLGGDEFLIVCIDCDQACAERTMQRIQDNYGGLGRAIARKWTLSFGCTELLHQGDSVDAMIERADAAMYVHKQQMKKQQSATPSEAC